ncbi:HesA/MoeB/ThiF family protein [Paracoccus sp. Z330]|uniref:HesA/MoeB/ThiF family protein n=1 Tax=Paracoccus onchidii TaxID=3017813 RepID=A0ABT4ZBJ9_9RHOB|nr:HesA/MoeB/ThiF family protein [Paracoccus onchidii]MDB6176101.1 HesA/MoeB/ThiF family protein [Paracoccus onchidii]
MLGVWLLAGFGAFGLILRLPGRVMGAALSLLWAGIIVLLAVAPDASLSRMVGGSAIQWLVAGGFAALVLGYRGLLGRLRARAIQPEPLAPSPEDDGLSGAELDRYARHLVLREIGGPGQMRLRRARVLVVGAGGLGSPVCLYLAAAGVGRITVADDDVVSLSNLQRQVIFRSDQRGEAKAEAAATAMKALNPHVQLTPLTRRVGAGDVDLFRQHDLIIDGSDSFSSRQAVNAVCVAAGVPLLAGSISQWEGQVTLYDPARGGPCLTCLFPDEPAAGLAPACAEAGVVGALPGVVGSLMALEAIKYLTGAGRDLRGRLMLFDGLYGENRVIKTQRRAGCSVCG